MGALKYKLPKRCGLDGAVMNGEEDVLSKLNSMIGSGIGTSISMVGLRDSRMENSRCAFYRERRKEGEGNETVLTGERDRSEITEPPLFIL